MIVQNFQRWSPCYCWRSGGVVVLAVMLSAFVSASAGVPALADFFPAAGISGDPGVPILAGVFSYCTVQ
jgi:hypothetical protein